MRLTIEQARNINGLSLYCFIKYHYDFDSVCAFHITVPGGLMFFFNGIPFIYLFLISFVIVSILVMFLMFGNLYDSFFGERTILFFILISYRNLFSTHISIDVPPFAIISPFHLGQAFGECPDFFVDGRTCVAHAPWRCIEKLTEAAWTRLCIDKE